MDTTDPELACDDCRCGLPTAALALAASITLGLLATAGWTARTAWAVIHSRETWDWLSAGWGR